MPTTEVILTDNVPGLGAEADVVKVRRGYARNYLLPQGKACEVTPAALRQLDTLKKKRAEREAREMNEAEEVSRKIGKARLTFTLATGESGKAFGSVTAQFTFDVKSAEQSRERGAAEVEQPEKKHRSFFRRKKETK